MDHSELEKIKSELYINELNNHNNYSNNRKHRIKCQAGLINYLKNHSPKSLW